MERVHLNGNVLDLGCSEGELKQFVKGENLLVNYDHNPMQFKKFDSSILLAFLDNTNVTEIYNIFQN
jgi:hypothetical protein